MPSARYLTYGGVQAVAANGRLAVYSAAFGGKAYLGLLDITDLRSPRYAGTIFGAYVYRALEIENDILFAGSDDFRVIDISDPAKPETLASLDSPSVIVDVALAGTSAFLAQFASGISIIDIRNPGTPRWLGSLSTPGEPSAISVSGGYAYLAAGTAGLHVIDVTDPRHPMLVTRVMTPGVAWDVAVRGSNAYVADGAAGLVVIDISRPADASIVGVLDTPGNAERLVVHDTVALVADVDHNPDWDWGHGEIHVIDISDPRSPFIEASLPEFAYALCVGNGMMCVGGVDGCGDGIGSCAGFVEISRISALVACRDRTRLGSQ